MSEGKKSLEGIETTIAENQKIFSPSRSEGKKSLEGIETNIIMADSVFFVFLSEGKKSLEGIETSLWTTFSYPDEFPSEGKKSLEGIETNKNIFPPFFFFVRRKEIPGRDWNSARSSGYLRVHRCQKERNPWKGLKRATSINEMRKQRIVRRKEIPGRDWNFY